MMSQQFVENQPAVSRCAFIHSVKIKLNKMLEPYEEPGSNLYIHALNVQMNL